jgi:hypothetical protein
MPKLITLSPEVTASFGFTHKVVITGLEVGAMTNATAYSVIPQKSAAGVWAMVATAAPAATLPAGTCVKQVSVRVTTAFVGDTPTFTIGDGGAVARYLASISFAAATFKIQTLLMPFTYAVADTIDIIPTQSANLAALSAGEVEIYLELRDLNDLNKPTILTY